MLPNGALVTSRAAPGAAVAHGRRALPAGWPIIFIFGSFPVWWALGMGSFVWPLLILPLALSFVLRGDVVLPRRFGLWLLFLAWMALSYTQIDGSERSVVFLYRAAIYLSATVLFLYVFGSSRKALPTQTVLNSMTVLWIVVILGGFLGIAAPHGSFHTLAESLMSPKLLSNELVYQMVHPGFAQVSTFLGYEVPRPRAPFSYTNGWGAAYGLLVPFVIAGFRGIRSLAFRRVVALLGVASLLPVAFSLDRGLWLSVGIGLLYAAVRLARRNDIRALGRIVVVVAVVGAALLVTPLGRLVGDRLDVGHSNEARTALYQESIHRVRESPLLGLGAPRPSEVNANLPSVGTQGHLWLLLVSHGVPGLLLFTGWFAYTLVRSFRLRGQVPFWMHIVVLVFLVQMPYYDLLPVPILLVMIASALLWREIADGQRGDIEP